jgi:putative transposase
MSDLENSFKVTEEEREELLALTRKRTIPQRIGQRARMILLFAEGETSGSIATIVGVAENTVKSWVERWTERSNLSILERFREKERSGAPPKYTVEQITAIMALACEKPAASGRSISKWSLGELRKEIIKREIVKEISKKSISRFLKRSQFTTA